MVHRSAKTIDLDPQRQRGSQGFIYRLMTIDWRRGRRGFTLIELLVVISIIGILAGLGTISYSATRASARDAQRKNDYKQIKTALQAYYADHNSRFPPGTGTDAAYYSNGTWLSTVTDFASLFPQNNVPKDPINKDTRFYYFASTGNNTGWWFHITMENKSDTTGPGPECANQGDAWSGTVGNRWICYSQ